MKSEKEKLSEAMRKVALISAVTSWPCTFNQLAIDICTALFKRLERRLIASVDRDGLALTTPEE